MSTNKVFTYTAAPHYHCKVIGEQRINKFFESEALVRLFNPCQDVNKVNKTIQEHFFGCIKVWTKRLDTEHAAESALDVHAVLGGNSHQRMCEGNHEFLGAKKSFLIVNIPEIVSSSLNASLYQCLPLSMPVSINACVH